MTKSNDLQAPSYNSLMITFVCDLQEKVRTLESYSFSESFERNSEEREPTQLVNYRLLPDLDRLISTFNGQESNNKAEDWIGTVDGLKKVNDWPFRYRPYEFDRCSPK